MLRSRPWHLAPLSCLLLLAACPEDEAGQGGGKAGPPPAAPVASLAAALEEAPPPEGPPFLLSEGSDQSGDTWTPVPPGQARPLDEAATKRLLDRLPALPQAAPRSFARREGPPPPELTGETVQQPFPPPAGPPAPDLQPQSAGPLEVSRHQPEGDVALVPHLSLTFSQPMVSVGSVAEVAEAQVPARLEPQPPGRWRWVGTRTLMFEPEGERFPMATEYRVTVPAGTSSAEGGKLAAALSWTFRTPPPTVEGMWPQGGPQPLEPTLAVRFDQRVDPAAALGAITVTAGGQPVELRLASEEEAALLRPTLPEGRAVLFRPRAPLPGDSAVSVQVGPGVPSLEGPRRSEQPQRFELRTFGPLKVTKHHAGWGDDCPPGAPFRVEFSNPLEPKAISSGLVKLEPEVPGLKVMAWGNTLQLMGLTKARTRYKATLDPAIRDTFGQTLGQAVTLEFQTTSAHPNLQGPPQVLIVLDPAGAPRVQVRSISVQELRVRVLAVDPRRDWRAFREWQGRRWRRDPPALPGREVLDEEREVAGSQDEWTETTIDLTPALKDGLGHALVEVTPVDWPEQRRGRKPTHVSWVQATRLGVDLHMDGDETLALVTKLADGSPLEGAQVELGGSSARSGADGVARLPVRGGDLECLVSLGADVALLPVNHHPHQPGVQLRWFTFDDRHLYRPKEEVRLKGWIRRVDLNEGGDVMALGEALKRVEYQVIDAHGQKIGAGKAELDPLGGFDLAFTIPDTAHVGQAAVHFAGDGRHGHAHGFQIAEFRRPEFEVSAGATSPGPHLVGGEATVEVSARYFAGGALPGAPVSWRVEARPTHFTPPNRSGWVFGEYVPWWLRGWDMDEEVGFRRGRGGWGAPAPAHSALLQGTTDASGEHQLRIGLRGLGGGRPMSLACEATVQDVNRQAWSASAALLVHPAEVYVGLKAKRPFVGQGEALEVEALAVDLEGRLAEGRPVQVAFERLDWTWEEGSYREEVAERQVKSFSSGKEPLLARVEKPAGGTWRVVALVGDAAGRTQRTTLQVWVAGGRMPPSRRIEEEQITLVPDREEYAAGDVAEVLVVAPFADAEGIFSVRRSGLVEARRIRLEGTTTTLRLPIAEGMVPDVTVHVTLVGTAPRGGKDPRPRPAFASGQLGLKVPPRARTLHVAVAPERTELEPGAETAVELEVKDAAGQPVAGAEVAVAVVDEAVLMLAGHAQPDPLKVFYSPRGPGPVRDFRSREMLQLDLPPEAAPDEDQLEQDGGADMERAMAPAPGGAPMRRGRAEAKNGAEALGAGGGGGGGEAPIQMRTDLRALAAFAPRVVTDGQGKARFAYKLPDSLTRYRIVAVAAAGANAFGAREGTQTARLPLMVRPSAPRFLNFGDTFELPVVVQNQTDAPLVVDVAVRAANLELRAGAGRQLTVPARERLEVRFPAAAARAGTTKIQVAASAGQWSDAQEVELPVWTPATSEAFATYGTIDGDGALAQPILVPEAWAEFGGLTLTTSSTGLQALTDAVIYLAEYPYGCAEQVASRALALVAVKDVLQAFQVAELPSAAVLEEKLAADLARLVQLQNPADGGWGFWEAGDPSWPYLTAHVAHALARARQKGYAVDQACATRGLQYLRQIERHIPGWYSPESRRALIAYALYVRAQLGDRDPQKASQLLREAGGPDKLSLEALGWIYPLLRAGAPADAQAVRRHFANRVVETAGAAHFATSYSDGAHVLLHSERRVDGVVLEALLDDPAEAKGDLAAKLVQGLLAHKKRGHWMNTQENAFILLALDRYFRVAEGVTPEFVARAWLGQAYAGQVSFAGRTTERQEVDVPMSWLQEAGRSPSLVLHKQGPGRLYYRIGLRYAPRDLKLQPLEAGFSVQRRYEAVDDPGDVKQQSDGSWWIKAGARVRVHLTMLAPARRYHVALVDPLPAGLEPLDPALRATGALPPDPGNDQARGRGCCWWWSRTWYEHQGLRDERAEAFTSLLWEGVHTYSYVARATTPGRFVAPPAKAEEMYMPETFGRSGTDVVIVE